MVVMMRIGMVIREKFEAFDECIDKVGILSVAISHPFRPPVGMV